MKGQMRIFKVFFIVIVLSGISGVCFGENMESENYKLEMGQFNMFAGHKSSESYDLVDTGGQLGPGVYKGKDYTVKSGLGYIKTFSPFGFSVSDSLISFNRLTPNKAEEEKSKLTVKMGSAKSYKVEAAETKPLTHLGNKNAIIADFRGDDGSCTSPNKECTWVVNSTYGFGYILRGDDLVGFSKDGTFRQFADLSDSEVPVELMRGDNVGGKRKVEITFKVNVGSKQQTGIYENEVIFSAIAGY